MLSKLKQSTDTINNVKLSAAIKNEITCMLTSIKQEHKEFTEIDTLLYVMAKAKIYKSDKLKYTNTCNKLIGDLKEKIGVDENENEDKLDEPEKVLTLDELKVLESELDSKVSQYNKFDDNNPMLGVSLCNTKKIWRACYSGTDRTFKNKKDATEIVKKLILGNFPKNTDFFLKICVAANFIYKNENFIIYGSVAKPLFDIRHIINVLHLGESENTNKYAKFKCLINTCTIFQNKFGGYVVRQFVDESSIYEIILSSASKLSKSFRSDVGKILVKLREEGKLTIRNNGLVYNGTTTDKLARSMDKDIVICDNDKDKDVIICDVDKDTTICDNDTYAKNKSTENNNPKHGDMVRFNNTVNQLVNATKIRQKKYNYKNASDILKLIQIVASMKLDITEYDQKHVLYCFIIPIYNDAFDVIIKFGYTENIVGRIKSLRTGYKCDDIFLIGIKIIYGASKEKEFHNSLKIVYPSLHYEYSMGSKIKEELYFMSDILMNEFNKIEECKPNNVEKILVKNSDELEQTQAYINQMSHKFMSVVMNIEKTNSALHLIKDDNLRAKILLEYAKNELAIELARENTRKEIELAKEHTKSESILLEIAKQAVFKIQEERMLLKEKHELCKTVTC